MECYPGVFLEQLERTLKAAFGDAEVCNVETAYLSDAALQARFAPMLTTDPVFGWMPSSSIAQFFDEQGLAELKDEVGLATSLIFLIGAVTARVHSSIWVYARRAPEGDERRA